MFDKVAERKRLEEQLANKIELNPMEREMWGSLENYRAALLRAFDCFTDGSLEGRKARDELRKYISYDPASE
ncbi:MAG: hypothetical protein WA021_01020 [Minisyncoccia bacterium]